MSLGVLSPADTQITQGLRTLQAETPLEAPPAEAPGPEGGFLPSPSPELSISQTPAQDGGTCVTLRAFQEFQPIGHVMLSAHCVHGTCGIALDPLAIYL